MQYTTYIDYSWGPQATPHRVYALIRHWLGLWCLTPLSTICQLYCDSQFYWWRKLSTGKDHQPAALYIQRLLLNQLISHIL